MVSIGALSKYDGKFTQVSIMHQSIESLGGGAGTCGDTAQEKINK